MRRTFALALVGALVLAASALAGGGTSIKTAPTISYGTQTFGNTANGPQIDGSRLEFWKAPLIAGDTLTIKFETSTADNAAAVAVYKAGVDDFSWPNEDPVARAYLASNLHGQLVYTAPSSGVYPITFGANYYRDGGAYDFTAYVQHQVRVQFTPSAIARRGSLAVGLRYPDGSAVSDPSLQLQVLGSWGKGWKLVGKARGATGGTGHVGYSLPSSTRHHSVRIRVVIAGANYKRLSVTRTVHVR
jgi:hypothetical protein